MASVFRKKSSCIGASFGLAGSAWAEYRNRNSYEDYYNMSQND